MKKALALAVLLLMPAAAARPATTALPGLEGPSSAAVDEARALVEAMVAAPNGPYSRVVWFCNDGSIQPARPFACRGHGGGVQHAEYSPERERLAELGWPVGTIFTATPFDELWDPATRHRQLRMLPLERYLLQSQGGWVLRHAQFLRGRLQVEDEERVGQELLQELVADPAWVDANLLTVRELLRAIPHHGGADRTGLVRRLAEQLAKSDASFQPLRIKIHNAPDAGDIERVQSWRDGAAKGGAAGPLLARADSLVSGLHLLMGPEGRLARLEAARRQLARQPRTANLAAMLQGLEQRALAGRVEALAGVMVGIRDGLAAEPPARRVRLIDMVRDVEEELRLASFDLLQRPSPPSRRLLFQLTADLVDAAYGAGLLSAGEREAAALPLREAAAADTLPVSAYLDAVQAARRVGAWAMGTVLWNFGDALSWMAALEPVAARYPDELLRGSVLLPLGEAVHALLLDAEGAAGTVHQVFGEPRAGLLGINPGLATGPLHVVDEALAGEPGVTRDQIVLLPVSVSELEPVAGILTLAEGNLLSHIQLLARNLGIPNAALSPQLARQLRERASRELLLGVSTSGVVVLEELDQLPPAVHRLLAADPVASAASRVRAPRPRLGDPTPLPLEQLDANMAGEVVGPKAANLGALHKLFPGRVAPTLALPFTVYAMHVRAGENSLDDRLRAAFRERERGELDEAGLLDRLESLRAEIEALTLQPEFAAGLERAMREEFGEAGGYGVFVRSDTNVEDLPQFTGAGLNRTVPHIVDPAALPAAIARVWASPFTPRALAWREQVLDDPEEVYVSVVLMRSVPSEKSGVLVTTNLAGGDTGYTVATSWGVGGAVDNESAETQLLWPDGRHRLLGEAKAPWQRRLRASGGVEWLPAPSGPVLTTDERAQLVTLVEELDRRREPERDPDGRPLPWDIEFGFVGGELQLFQIRPLVQKDSALADRVVELLAGRPAEHGPGVPVAAPVAPAAWPAPGAGGEL